MLFVSKQDNSCLWEKILDSGGSDLTTKWLGIRVRAIYINCFKSADHLIRCSTFNMEYDGNINFLINQKARVNNRLAQ